MGSKWLFPCCSLLLVVLRLSSSWAYEYNYCGAPPQVSATNTSYTLEFVQVIFRHGDRTTLTQIPGNNYEWVCNLTTYEAPSQDNDASTPAYRLFRKSYLPGREPSPGNCYGGQLTTRGFQQHVELGQNLRSLYVDNYKFLPPTYNESYMAYRSTDVPRTFASAQGNSFGMYPPTVADDPNAVPVIDVYTMDSSYENMYPNSGLCPRAAQIMGSISNQPEYLGWVQEQTPLKLKIAGILNVSIGELPSWSGLLDAFQVMTCYDQTYPNMPQEVIDQIFANANWQWNYQLSNPELVTLQIGSFTQELVQNIISVVSGLDMPQYLVFSGHDTTVGPLLASLQAYDGQWPPYASHVEIELWSNQGDFYVQVKYQGEPILLPTCSAAMCPFTEFMELVEEIVMTDFASACQPI